MKIYVRPRNRNNDDVDQQQFRIVAITGEGTQKVKFQAKRLRKSELEMIAEDTGATLVYMETFRHTDGDKE
ncbi:hypothetical protein [Methanogenium cariaci]|jgi:hypothetical protein|uniref:hypothetical protein n=1 Tax=Methanogenium cariaci TaxID=2197 RepID=UPI000784743F|nr:hypothetical protein [Methanogenium cariaci]